jgi:hypothetical protein
MWGSFPVDTAKIAKVTAICMSDLIPMIIPPRGLTVYLYGVLMSRHRSFQYPKGVFPE